MMMMMVMILTYVDDDLPHMRKIIIYIRKYHHHDFDHNRQVLFKISHNDLRDRAVFDANGVEIPTGYRRKMLSMLPVS